VVWLQNHYDVFSRFSLKTGGDALSRFGLKTGAFGFLDLGLKTDSYGLMVWASNHHDGFLVCVSKPIWLWFVGCARSPTKDEYSMARIEI
jgi:hypothetical protein